MKKSLFMAAILAVLVLASCGRYNKNSFVEVDTNETAFVIDLKNPQNQASMPSMELLKSQMVNTGRIVIKYEKVKTGWGWWAYEFKPLVRVIKVNRAPVSREWTQRTGDETVKAPGLESVESIGLYIGTTITAYIEEGEDTVKFLYLYGGRALKDVMDDEIKSYIKTQYGNEFATMPFEDIKINKIKGVNKAAANAKTFFKERGITISQIGFTEGLLFDNDSIQKAIDAKAEEDALAKAESAKKERIRLENENAAAKAKNQREIEKADADMKRDNSQKDQEMNAKAERFKAEQAAANIATTRELQKIEIEKMKAQAALEFAKNPNIKLPNVVSEKTFTLMGLDSLLPTSKQ